MRRYTSSGKHAEQLSHHKTSFVCLPQSIPQKASGDLTYSTSSSPSFKKGHFLTVFPFVHPNLNRSSCFCRNYSSFAVWRRATRSTVGESLLFWRQFVAAHCRENSHSQRWCFVPFLVAYIFCWSDHIHKKTKWTKGRTSMTQINQQNDSAPLIW